MMDPSKSIEERRASVNDPTKTHAQLRVACSEVGLSRSGTIEDLRKRLLKYLDGIEQAPRSVVRAKDEENVVDKKSRPGLSLHGILSWLLMLFIILATVVFAVWFLRVREEGRPAQAAATPTAMATAPATPTARPLPTATPAVTEVAQATTRPVEAIRVMLTPPEIPDGFTADPELVDISGKVDPRPPAEDLSTYQKFADVSGVWGDPRVGYSFGYNDACRDVSRFCNIQIVTWKWVAVTGEEIDLPGIGSIKDPDGGAALAIVVNVWEIPGEFERAYIKHGFWATGEVWDMSDMTDNADHNNPVYGAYTLETATTLRDHYLYRLGYSDRPSGESQWRGQCSTADNCETVTWVVVLRWYDGSFRLVDTGQWVR